MREASIAIRQAEAGDLAALRAFCDRLDSNDYARDAWEGWLWTPGDLNLIAAFDDQVIGCLRAGVVSPGQAFSQALRVDPALRRRGVARRLMAAQDERLLGRGVTQVRGVTAFRNERARRFFASIGWTEVGVVARRALGGWRGDVALLDELSLDAAAEIVERTRPLVSRSGVAHFRRIYFAPSPFWLAEAVAAKSARGHHDAAAFLDPVTGGDRWLHTLAGPAPSVAALLETILAPRRDRLTTASVLTVDAPDDPSLQGLLDERGFAPAGPHDHYVLVQAPPPC